MNLSISLIVLAVNATKGADGKVTHESVRFNVALVADDGEDKTPIIAGRVGEFTVDLADRFVGQFHIGDFALLPLEVRTQEGVTTDTKRGK